MFNPKDPPPSWFLTPSYVSPVGWDDVPRGFEDDIDDPTIPLDALTHADLLELAELIIADGLLELSEDALDNLEPATERSC